MDLKSMGTSIWSWIQSKSKWIVYGVLAIIAISSILRYVEFHCQHQTPSKVVIENKGPKADFSSDINWLDCRQTQLECIYKNVENSQFLIQNCGDITYCDEHY